jgi:hypothetical protein
MAWSLNIVNFKDGQCKGRPKEAGVIPRWLIQWVLSVIHSRQHSSPKKSLEIPTPARKFSLVKQLKVGIQFGFAIFHARSTNHRRHLADSKIIKIFINDPNQCLRIRRQI